jgi:hydrogenase maturation protein HypF
MVRLAITVDGIVQGVGFRPFVYGLAARLDLRGFVRNRGGSVEIEAEGSESRLDQFLKLLSTSPPPLSKIERISSQKRSPLGDPDFCIQHSQISEKQAVFISPDIATCDGCLLDLFDPKNRRHLYPFVNCTHCGPRLTIVKAVPYDRHRTTMAGFAMCDDCRAEYENPLDRRFHAQPICCPNCGPRLMILDRSGNTISTVDPIQHLARTIEDGKIAAIKGLGGYHLTCDARNQSAVKELRCRKHRDEKPLAIMLRDLASVRKFCAVDATEAALLQSSSRPIVLLHKKPDQTLAASIAPGNSWLGVMLPYTPIHHLLMQAVDGAPLVMTSGNSSDEPIAYDDADAIARLADIADLFLMHDRPIHILTL